MKESIGKAWLFIRYGESEMEYAGFWGCVFRVLCFLWHGPWIFLMKLAQFRQFGGKTSGLIWVVFQFYGLLLMGSSSTTCVAPKSVKKISSLWVKSRAVGNATGFKF